MPNKLPADGLSASTRPARPRDLLNAIRDRKDWQPIVAALEPDELITASYMMMGAESACCAFGPLDAWETYKAAADAVHERINAEL